MKQFILVAIATVLAMSAAGSPADFPELESYLTKTLWLCPGARTVLEKVDVQGPEHFDAYRLSMTSEVEKCRERTFALHSAATNQVIVGQVVPLEAGKTPAAQVQAFLTKQLGEGVETRILDETLPDGLKRVKISKPSPTGPVVLYAYLDESQKFLIMGRRGNLRESPKASLFEDLNVEEAVSRGPMMARIEILELSDFQCPACRTAHRIIEPYVKKYGDQIHYMRLDLPITDFHDWSMKAALGGRAIQKLAPKHYWTYVDYIFRHQPDITVETIDQVVRDFVEGVGLSWESFRPHYESPSERDRLNRQAGRAYQNNIYATPTILVNGRPVYYGEEASGLRAYFAQLFGEDLSAPASP